MPFCVADIGQTAELSSARPGPESNERSPIAGRLGDGYRLPGLYS